MKVFLRNRNKEVDAQGEYNKETQALTVLKGSRVSKTVSESPTFRGSLTIQRERAKYVKEGIVQKDVVFKSSSTAANFVTGNSTNGLRSWKTEDGTALKDLQ